MNKTANRQVICEVLMEQAETDKDIVVLCSDSRGSASLTNFAREYPNQFVETGIAEQNLVSIAAALAKCGKRVFAASPASFISARSYEQIKVDVAYSDTNVTLIGISGGISYGALGMSHHSAQDIAALSAIPNMRVYLPCDRHETRCLMEALVKDDRPAYLRVGRNPVEDVYEDGGGPFVMDQAVTLMDGSDVLLVACGEMVRPVLDAARMLRGDGIEAAVLDMYCLKPMDRKTLVEKASGVKAVMTVEEHSPFGGLGAMVSQAIGEECPRTVVHLALPDEPVISGTSGQVFEYYGLDAEGIRKRAVDLMKQVESCRQN